MGSTPWADSLVTPTPVITDDIETMAVNALKKLVEQGCSKEVETGIGMVSEPTEAYEEAVKLLDAIESLPAS